MTEHCPTCDHYNLYRDEEYPPCDECILYSNYKAVKELTISMEKQILDGSAKSSLHYQKAAIQPIEYMQMVLTPDEFIGFLKGNIMKYTARCGHKDLPVKEAAKIEQYSTWLREALEGKKIKTMEGK